MEGNNLLLADDGDPFGLFMITIDGPGAATVSYIGPMDHSSKGLSHFPPTGISDPADVYRITLGAGQSATVVVASQSRDQVDMDVELLDGGGALLALEMKDASNVDAYIRDFVSPTGGTFYVRVTSSAASDRADYSLVLTRGATFDLESNNTPAEAQDISVSGQALGHTAAKGPPGTTTEGTPVSLPINLFDSEGFLWDITRFGEISNGTIDAYDGGHYLDGFPSFTTGSAEDNGREIVIGPATIADVEVVRKIFIPQDQTYARFLDIVTNPGASTVNFTVDISTNLGSDCSTVLVGTSGGGTFSTDDDWMVTDDSDGTGDPTMLHVIAGPGAQRPSTASLSSCDSIEYSYNLTLEPGETKIVMHFGAQSANQADALEKAPLLAVLDLNALAGMTEAERTLVVNFLTIREDHYRFQVSEGDSLIITTTTPGGEASEPVNDLDPLIELFDENDVLVATDDNSAGDGRNARITYTVLGGSSGSYRVVISTPEGAEEGDYTLVVSGATGALPPFEVTTTEPASGTLLSLYPNTYRVNFNQAVLFSSADAGDLLVNGSPADGVAIVDADTLEFDITSGSAGDGLYSVTMASGVLTSLAGTPLSAVSRTLDVDLTNPTVVASSIEEGDTVPSGGLVYQVQFSELLTAEGLGGEDVTLVENLSGASIVPDLFVYDAEALTVTVTYTNLREGEYTLTLLSSATAFRDRRGNLLDGTPSFPLPSGDGTPGDPFVVNFILDNVSEVFPTLLQAVLPHGSLVYDPPLRGLFNAVSDVDTYTIPMDGGQTITLRLTPRVSSITARIEVFDISSTSLGIATAGVAGETVVFQNALADVPGTYTFTLTSLAGTGLYDVQVVLGAALEAEQYGGTPNDSIGTAQDIDASAIPLQGAAERLAVLGETESGSDDFFAFDLQAGEYASLAATSLTGGAVKLALLDASDVLALGVGGAENVDQSIIDFLAANGGRFYARLSLVATNTPYSLVVTKGATFDLEPNTDADAAQFLGPTNQVLGATAVGHQAATEVTPVSLPINLFDSEGYLWDIWRTGYISNGTIDAYDAGHILTGFPNFTTGSAEDNGREIVIGPATISGVEVVRKIFVPQDQAYARFLEIVTNPGAFTVNFTVSIHTNLGSNCSTVLVGTSGGGGFTTDDDWIVTDDANGTGDPTVLHVIAGPSGQRPSTASLTSCDDIEYTYDLTLGPGETKIVMHFGAQNANRAAALAKAPLLAALELNALAGMTRVERAQVVNLVEPNEDHYSFQVTGGDVLDLRTTTPGGAAGEPVNEFDPRIELFNELGFLAFADDNSDGDGRNARVIFAVPEGTSGYFSVRVSGENRGDYTLAITGATAFTDTPPFVISTSPADGQNLTAPPTAIDFSLSEAVRVDSVDLTDLTINGGATVVGVELLDGRTVRFTVAVPDVEGVYNYTLPTAAFVDLQGEASVEYQGSFSIDRAGPRVVAQTPALQTSSPFTELAFTFNEEINPDTFTSADVVSFTGPGGVNLSSAITGVSGSGTEFTVTFNAQGTQGTYTMVIGPTLRTSWATSWTRTTMALPGKRAISSLPPWTSRHRT